MSNILKRMKHTVPALAMTLALTGCNKEGQVHPCETLTDEIAKRICAASQGEDRPILYTEGQGEIHVKGDEKSKIPEFDGIAKDCGVIIVNETYHSNPCVKGETTNTTNSK